MRSYLRVHEYTVLLYWRNQSMVQLTHEYTALLYLRNQSGSTGELDQGSSSGVTYWLIGLSTVEIIAHTTQGIQ